MKLIDLKVFVNKRTGQSTICLPKKMFIKVPANIKVAIPKSNIKKSWRMF